MTRIKKCSICGRVVAKKLSITINAAVIGEYIPLTGHEVCTNNVDRKVIIPNRGRAIGLEKKA